MAVRMGKLDIVQFLLKRQNIKDVNVQDKEGRTPLYVAGYEGRTNLIQCGINSQVCIK
jgi:ankyrin repeat protein